MGIDQMNIIKLSKHEFAGRIINTRNTKLINLQNNLQINGRNELLLIQFHEIFAIDVNHRVVERIGVECVAIFQFILKLKLQKARGTLGRDDGLDFVDFIFSLLYLYHFSLV